MAVETALGWEVRELQALQALQAIGAWGHTWTNAVEKAPNQNHLKGFGCFTEGHEKCSYQHDQVGEHLALFPEKKKKDLENLVWNEKLLYSFDYSCCDMKHGTAIPTVSKNGWNNFNFG